MDGKEVIFVQDAAELDQRLAGMKDRLVQSNGKQQQSGPVTLKTSQDVFITRIHARIQLMMDTCVGKMHHAWKSCFGDAALPSCLLVGTAAAASKATATTAVPSTTYKSRVKERCTTLMHLLDRFNIMRAGEMPDVQTLITQMLVAIKSILAVYETWQRRHAEMRDQCSVTCNHLLDLCRTSCDRAVDDFSSAAHSAKDTYAATCKDTMDLTRVVDTFCSTVTHVRAFLDTIIAQIQPPEWIKHSMAGVGSMLATHCDMARAQEATLKSLYDIASDARNIVADFVDLLPFSLKGDGNSKSNRTLLERAHAWTAAMKNMVDAVDLLQKRHGNTTLGHAHYRFYNMCLKHAQTNSKRAMDECLRAKKRVLQLLNGVASTTRTMNAELQTRYQLQTKELRRIMSSAAAVVSHQDFSATCQTFTKQLAVLVDEMHHLQEEDTVCWLCTYVL